MRKSQCVDVRGKEERLKFIEKLEANGYEIDTTPFDRNEIINGVLPIVVDFNNKKISMMGNVTTAAAAASCGIVMKQAEFEKILHLDL